MDLNRPICSQHVKKSSSKLYQLTSIKFSIRLTCKYKYIYIYIRGQLDDDYKNLSHQTN
jgi:hypothetical protein